MPCAAAAMKIHNSDWQPKAKFHPKLFNLNKGGMNNFSKQTKLTLSF